MRELVSKHILSSEAVSKLKDKVLEIFRIFNDREITHQWSLVLAALLPLLPIETLRGQMRSLGITHSCLSSSLPYRIISAHCIGSLFSVLDE